jgi:mono/diheme cytochrome c family protein
MKAFQQKIPALIIFVLFMTVLSIYSCGQQETTGITDEGPEATKQEVLNADSLVIANANQDTTMNADKTQVEIKTDPKKEIVSTNQSKVQEPQKKPTTEKPVTPSPVPGKETKPVVQPEKTPDVKVPEQVKPPPTDPNPKPVVDPKPAPPVTSQPATNNWIVPAKYKTMTNPYPVNTESIALGKSIYATHCKSCHGTKADGNGTKAAGLDTKIESFLISSFLSQKPGEVYYKTITGRKDMPRFDKKIPDDEERWAIVHYIMNFKN